MSKCTFSLEEKEMFDQELDILITDNETSAHNELFLPGGQNISVVHSLYGIKFFVRTDHLGIKSSEFVRRFVAEQLGDDYSARLVNIKIGKVVTEVRLSIYGMTAMLFLDLGKYTPVVRVLRGKVLIPF